MPVTYPAKPAQQFKRPLCNFRQLRTETERQRRAEYGRINVASALKLKGAY